MVTRRVAFEYKRLWTAFVDAALGRSQCVDLYDTNLPNTPDGSAIRNYIHVEDLARAHLNVLAHHQAQNNAGRHRGENFGVWNVAGKDHVSSLEFIEAARQVSSLFVPICSKDKERSVKQRAKFEPTRIDASVEKLQATGWERKYNSIHDILSTSWEWTRRVAREEAASASDISKPVDICVIGAGLSGSVLAERHASQNRSVLVIEKRNHIGGNCYDYIDKETGIRVSKYGVHLFHTQSERVWAYMRRFSQWTKWEHRVLADVNSKLVPVPVNIDSVNTLFNLSIFSESEMEKWLKSVQIQPKDGNATNSEEIALARVGQHLYDLIFKPYTIKQWEKNPKELAPSVLARIPVRTNHDDRYFTDQFQALPSSGYSRIFENMLGTHHPHIKVHLNTDYFKVRDDLTCGHTYYTGPIDGYFAAQGLPKLEYRSLRFERRVYHNKEFYQPRSQVNHPSLDKNYTRIIEYKHLLHQKSNDTVVFFEYSSDNGEPYYPVPNKDNQDLYAKYQALADTEVNVSFVGRLANYKYFNMDQAVLNALELFDSEQEEFDSAKTAPSCPTDEESFLEMLKLASIPLNGKSKLGIVFTTVTIDKDHADHVKWLSNWYGRLLDASVQHPIVFGVDGTGETCKIARSIGICCRDFNPKDFEFAGETLPMKTRDGGRPPAVDMKFFYAFEILSYGYRISFSDDDVCWIKHPFYDNEFEEDMRGLTDDRTADDPIDGWTTSECGFSYGSPCMSTGLWDIYPTEKSLGFLSGLMDGLTNTHIWEQSLANMYLIAEREKDNPMPFQLFSKSTHSNVLNVDLRVESNKPINLSAVHLGNMQFVKKAVEIKKRGYWHPKNFTNGASLLDEDTPAPVQPAPVQPERDEQSLCQYGSSISELKKNLPNGLPNGLGLSEEKVIEILQNFCSNAEEEVEVKMDDLPSVDRAKIAARANCSTAAKSFSEMLKLASMQLNGKSKHGIVFTTVTIDKDHVDHVKWVSNWYGRLLDVGVQHPIIFGVDDTGETCDIVRSIGVCCRDFNPKDFEFAGETLPMRSRDGVRPPSGDMKHFYAFEILSHGYRVSFSDDDVYWMKHPFYDNEFLEDMRGLTDDRMADDQKDGWTPLDCGLSYGSPCMSTGLWDMHSTRKSIDFLSGLLDGLRTTSVNDQVLANIYLKAERENDTPMSFRLFPKSTHANVGVLDKRVASNKPMNLAAVHLGYILRSSEKLEEFKKRGYWHPKNFTSNAPLLDAADTLIQNERALCQFGSSMAELKKNLPNGLPNGLGFSEEKIIEILINFCSNSEEEVEVKMDDLPPMEANMNSIPSVVVSNTVPRLYCSTDEKSFPEMLERASIPLNGKSSQGIVFTTVTIDKDHAGHVKWVSNWYNRLLQVGVQHPIIFGVDDTGETCDIVKSIGMCCRDFNPKDFEFAGKTLPMKSRDGRLPPAVDMKYFYAFEILSQGYRVSFSDDDVYWMKHPFYDNEFLEDMRGLSDDRTADDQKDGWTSLDCGLTYGSPCMSAGLWDIYPTSESINFLSRLLDGLRSTKAWEQALANIYLKANRENDELMSFRLFPKSTHANVGVLDKRVASNKPMNLAAVHLGYILGSSEKLEEYKKRGYWHPKNFTSNAPLLDTADTPAPVQPERDEKSLCQFGSSIDELKKNLPNGLPNGLGFSEEKIIEILNNFCSNSEEEAEVKMDDLPPMEANMDNLSQMAASVTAPRLNCRTDEKPFRVMLKSASVPLSGKSFQGIVFTTVTIKRGHADHVKWVSNWYGQLLDVGVQHPIIFGVDDTGETCDIVRSIGMCCRDFNPKDFEFAGETLPMKSRDGRLPPAMDMKYFYAYEILSHGYRVSFSDDDVYWLKHPFNDNEFLEDMRGLTDDQMASDQKDGWTAQDCYFDYGSPCMSTGLWDIYPTSKSIGFLSGLLDGLRTTSEWEQKLANKLLRVEREKDEPMLFRLFSKSTHANIAIVEKLEAANNNMMDLAAVHLTNMNEIEKFEEIKKRGYWHPKNFITGEEYKSEDTLLPVSIDYPTIKSNH